MTRQSGSTGAVRRWLVVPAALLFVAACGDSQGSGAPRMSPSPPAGTPAAGTPGPAVSPDAGACPGEAQAIRGVGRSGSVIRSDVDGDGALDEVSVALATANPPGCRAFVVVATATGATAAPIAAWSQTTGLPAPRINSIVPIDERPGGEIIVDVAAGASTQFAGVFTTISGRAAPLVVEGTQAPTENLFAYGGSAGHLDAVDCASEDSVVASSAVFAPTRGNRYTIERRFYDVGSTGFDLDAGRTEEHELGIEDAMAAFPEFESSPFGSCV